jgi:hypothetical protein
MHTHPYQGFRQIVIDDVNPGNAAQSVFAIDVDGDGDMDVLAASKFDWTIAWYYYYYVLLLSY